MNLFLWLATPLLCLCLYAVYLKLHITQVSEEELFKPDKLIAPLQNSGFTVAQRLVVLMGTLSYYDVTLTNFSVTGVKKYAFFWLLVKQIYW